MALRIGAGTGTTVLSWLLSDHLGSQAITADSSGTKTGELRYKAWGETRHTWGTTPTKRQYTGQLNDTYINLYFYQSRFYDASLGRFVQADTIIPNPGDVQSWDRYAAMANNPVRYIDPTGHAIGPAIHDSYGDAACLDPDHCLDAIGMSKLSQSSKDVGISRVRIGARPATQPSLTGPYNGQPIDDTCFNCSVEPQVSGAAAGLASVPDVLNFAGATALNIMATYGPEAIFLFAYRAEYSNGNVSVDSLEVVNTTNMDISVMSADFAVSGSPYCAGTCISPYTDSYSIVPGPSIHPPDGYYGLGTVGANSRGHISLTQPGGGNRPSNLFYSYQSVAMTVSLASTDTGNRWSPIVYAIR